MNEQREIKIDYFAYSDKDGNLKYVQQGKDTWAKAVPEEGLSFRELSFYEQEEIPDEITSENYSKTSFSVNMPADFTESQKAVLIIRGAKEAIAKARAAEPIPVAAVSATAAAPEMPAPPSPTVPRFAPAGRPSRSVPAVPVSKDEAKDLSIFIADVDTLTEKEISNLFNPKTKANITADMSRETKIKKEAEVRGTREQQNFENLENAIKDKNPDVKIPLLMEELKKYFEEALAYMSKVATEKDQIDKVAAKRKAIEPTVAPAAAASKPAAPEPVPLTTGPDLSAVVATKPNEKGAYNMLPLIDFCNDNNEFKKGFNRVDGKGTAESRIFHYNPDGEITARSDGSMTNGKVDFADNPLNISAKLVNTLCNMADIHLITKASTSNPSKHPPLPIDLKVNRNNLTTPEQKEMADKIDKIVEKAVGEYLKKSKDPDALKMFTFNGKAIELAEEKKDVKEAKDTASLKMSMGRSK